FRRSHWPSARTAVTGGLHHPRSPQDTILALTTMPVVEFLTSSGLGSLLRMRHPLQPHHLAAVSTLVSQERNGFRAAWLGVCWGIGHTLALVVVAVALIVLRAELPAAAANLFELLVAAMLIALGVRAIVIAWRQGGGAGAHRHG